MQDGFQHYDRWKTRSPDDEDYEREQNRLRDEQRMDRADYERDRMKDDGRDVIDLPADPTDLDE